MLLSTHDGSTLPPAMMPVLLGGVIAFAVALGLLPLVMRVARRQRWMAPPREDRWHQRPTALLGGVGIFGAWALGLMAVGMWPTWHLLGGAALLLSVGVIDDLYELRPMHKLLGQLAAALLPVLAGLTFGDRLPVPLAVPLTLFWMIGVINALNLIDGMDGLAGGVAAIAAAVLGTGALMVGDVPAAIVAFTLTGACVGFLVYNLPPARVFMGDGGSLFLGYTLAVLALRVQGLGEATTDRLILLALPVAVLAVPIFDTTLVTIMRTLHGRPVTQGGTDHLMHRLLYLGLSERRTLAVLYGISLIYGLLALGLMRLPPGLAAATGALIAVLTIGVGLNVAAADVYRLRDRYPDPEERGAELRWGHVLHRLMGREWKAMFGLAADLVLMGVVAVLLHELHGARALTLDQGEDRAIAVALAVKLGVFYVGGLYRGIWRYAGTPELMRIALVGTAATCASALSAAAFPSIPVIPAAVLLSDAALTVAMLTLVRLGLRAGRQMLSSGRQSGRRVLLYGAGDGGMIALREIRQNPELDFAPVGFLDDDRLKQGMRVQGLPVLGGLATLVATCRTHRCELVLITSRRMTSARRVAIIETCAAAGIACRVLQVSFEEAPATGLLGPTGDGARGTAPTSAPHREGL